VKILLLLLLCSDISLKAPDSCEIGELVRLDASESDSETLIWEVIPETPDFEAVGKKAFFSSRRTGEYLFIIAGSEDNKPVLHTHKVYIQGKSDLAQQIRQWLTRVRSEDGQEEARKLAQSFRFVAGSTHVDLENFLETTSKSNRMVLGESLDAWKPFLDGLGRYLDQNPPRTLERYRDTWNKIADAIERNLES
jgi:hypothetical protein